MAVRIIADSLAMTARSSAAVLHALTCRMRSLNLRDMLKNHAAEVRLQSNVVMDKRFSTIERRRFLSLKKISLATKSAIELLLRLTVKSITGKKNAAMDDVEI